MMPHRLSPGPRHPEEIPSEIPGARARLARGLTCLLTTLHPERSLSFALVQHLAEELPDIDFTLEDRPGIDVVWVCGYERGNASLVRALRTRHPSTMLLVTSREPEDLWSEEVVAAGADSALAWPADLARVGRVLRRRVLQHRA